MLDHPLQDIDAWVLLFSNNSMPILRVTKRRLDDLRAHIDDVDARELSRVIVQDPMMTARVFAFTHSIGSRSLQREITTVASAVMMMGIEPFFNTFNDLTTIEGMLKGEDKHALLGVLQIIRRAQRAADYAQEWAIWRNDVNMEEVRIAALLHDLAELLVWTFAPSLGLEIHAQQLAHPDLRSCDAQRNTLGMTFQEIQEALCRTWHLPELLQNLINENSTNLRERNVSLAVRLARHSAHGWDNPALPDDYIEIGQLLNLSPEAVRQRIGVDPMPAREADGAEVE
ncbi:MAG: HDOD domain-containing protein [Dechloromonas sp.]|jgi:HD-like signal output (HDOD) protein|uniref:HDOD domain-containing protein n=1 Tax=Candidatus Dechloromonas phosphorivorans TaxID=2899244 RepID=A0A935JX33_9RHOO|nr:HDOD domain-containing protein [Candidatus Dechloromonas phosphorivorans]